MSDYTPTTTDVREAYGDSQCEGFHSVPTFCPADAEFDRWLTAHDAQVRADTLEEAGRLIDDRIDVKDSSNPVQFINAGLTIAWEIVTERAASIRDREPTGSGTDTRTTNGRQPNSLI
jgi:hypothetical protein